MRGKHLRFDGHLDKHEVIGTCPGYDDNTSNSDWF
jgi:hypothetical protein